MLTPLHLAGSECVQADAVEELKTRAAAIDVRLLPELGHLHREVEQCAAVAHEVRNEVGLLSANFDLAKGEVRRMATDIGVLRAEMLEIRSRSEPPPSWEDTTEVRRARDPRWQEEHAALSTALRRKRMWKIVGLVAPIVAALVSSAPLWVKLFLH